jgi:hypothetical protein
VIEPCIAPTPGIVATLALPTMPARVNVTAEMTGRASARKGLGVKSVKMTSIARLIAMDAGKFKISFPIVIKIQFFPFGLRMALITALAIFTEVNILYLMTTSAVGCFKLVLLTRMATVALQLLVPAEQRKFRCVMVKLLTPFPTLALMASATFFPECLLMWIILFMAGVTFGLGFPVQGIFLMTGCAPGIRMFAL